MATVSASLVCVMPLIERSVCVTDRDRDMIDRRDRTSALDLLGWA